MLALIIALLAILHPGEPIHTHRLDNGHVIIVGEPDDTRFNPACWFTGGRIHCNF